jgi:chromosome segregation ATPase
VSADFARELERELAAVKADLAQRTADLERMTAQRNAALDARDITQRTLDGIDGVLAQRTAERDEAWLTNATLRADLARANAERDALAAEVAALKPQSNANNSAPIPLKEWVIEVFQHLCHSPHTPDEWKRDLDKKTNALLNAIEQEKERKPC